MTVSATTVESGFKSIRDAINSGISSVDIDSASDDALALGDGNLFNKTWYGPQGFKIWSFFDGENRGEWAWTTALTKTANKAISSPPVPSTEYAVLAQEQLQDVWGTGKRFYVPRPGMVHIHLVADVISPTLNEWGVNYRLINYNGNTASYGYLFVDGVKQRGTLGYSFEDSIGTPPSGEVGHGLTDAQNEPSKLWVRRYYSVFYTTYLYEGWHEVQFKIDCRNERTYVARRGLYIEGAYYF